MTKLWWYLYGISSGACICAIPHTKLWIFPVLILCGQAIIICIAAHEGEFKKTP